MVIGAADLCHTRKNRREKSQSSPGEAERDRGESKAEEENNTLHMVAAGDNLIHDALINAGKENDWNFDFLYENIKSSRRPCPSRHPERG